ncbi:MAG: glutaredoxin domain-containing protein [Burkholderiaceae bacterium]
MKEEHAHRASPGRATWFDRHTPTFALRYRASRTYRMLTWTLIVLIPTAVALHLFTVLQKQRHDPRRQPAGAITVLVTERCPFSRELEATLKSAGLSYRRIDVEKDEGGDWAYYALNARGVPVTVIGTEIVYGLRTTLLRTTLERAGQDVSRLRFKRETDVPMSTLLKP